MADNELLIKIKADAKDVTTAFEDVKSKTADLEDKLNNIAKISGIAFAALSTQVVVALHAFAESEKATNTLTNALQNQGIFTEDLRDSYKGYAEEISKVTGLEADNLVQAQAVAQSFLGQVPVTKDLTAAIADLAEQQGISLPSAAEQLGKAIGSGTGMLLRQGLQFASTDTEAQRYQKTLDFVTVKAGGFAETANQGLGSIRGLQTAFKETQQELGERFAPAAEYVIKLLTEFLTPAEDDTGVFTDFKAIAIAVGLALTSVGIAIPLVVNGFLALRAALIAIQIASAPLLLIPVAIAAIVAAVIYLGLNWEKVRDKVVPIVQFMVTFISEAFSGLGAVLKGAMSANWAAVTEGLAKIKQAYAEGLAAANDVAAEETEKGEETQLKIKKEAADKEANFRKEQDGIKKQLAKAQQAYTTLETEKGSKDFIALKKKEIDTLTALEKSHDAEEREALKKKLAGIMEEESKFGTFRLALAKTMNSDEIQGTKQATGELTQLAQSKNSTLKAIGKAASIAQIVMKTAESAMNVFNGFSIIPIIGPVLGVAGAAAAIAFGAEQIGNVIAAADGGMITGGMSGRDSVPAMLMPGELVVPTRNFDEVVSSVATNRGNGESGQATQSSTKVMIGFDGREASQVLTARQNEDKALGISRAV